ncbi:hypothetical protein BHE74_00023655 [Ensete ventricosum]|nr:hypothetical protein BHE74_00023655 [Ensete ventricosum]
MTRPVACVALGQAVCRTSTRVGPTQVPTRAYAEPHRNSLHLHRIIDSQKKSLSRTARRGDSRRRFRTESINYLFSWVCRIVKEVVEGPSRNLLESVAHVIANTTLLKFPQISAVRVIVGKPHVAVHGTIDYLGVEILRHRDQAHDKREPE